MKRLAILILLAALVMPGCSKEPKQQDNAPGEQTQASTNTGAAPEQTPQQNPATNPQAQQTPPAEQPVRHKPAPKKEEPAAPAQPTMVVRQVPVAPGTELVAALDQKLSTETDKAGTTFTGTLAGPYERNGVTILPAGTKIKGDIIASSRAHRIGGKAEMKLEFKQITTPDGQNFDIFAEPLTLVGKSTTAGDVGKIAGGAVGGAIVGGILGGKKGAIEGGAAGGAAGTGWAVATRGNDIVLDPGAQMKLTLRKEITVPVQMPSDQPVP